MKRPIHISLGPNYENDDVFLALKTLFNPLKWFDKSEIEKLEEEFADIFNSQGNTKYKALAINSGRSAQYLILKAFKLSKDDEVAIQAFTCVAVPNSVSWSGAKPLFVDIDKNFNIDIKDLKGKITNNTKAIIFQHTFGIPADMAPITQITFPKKIAIIQDCAHSLGAVYKKTLVGSGPVAFFSFGRDKIISSVFGGVILVHESNFGLFNQLKNLRDRLSKPSILWTLQQLIHPLALFIVLPTYNLFNLGKGVLFLLQKTNLLSRAVCAEEKSGSQPGIFPSKMPPALAVLARHQLKKLDRFNSRRHQLAQYYLENLKSQKVSIPTVEGGQVWLRFPILVKDPQSLIKYAKKHGVILGDWYKEVIAPCSDPTVVGYEWGSCPNAEDAAKHIVNLPTYPTMTLKDAEKVVHLIKEWQATP